MIRLALAVLVLALVALGLWIPHAVRTRLVAEEATLAWRAVRWDGPALVLEGVEGRWRGRPGRARTARVLPLRQQVVLEDAEGSVAGRTVRAARVVAHAGEAVAEAVRIEGRGPAVAIASARLRRGEVRARGLEVAGQRAGWGGRAVLDDVAVRRTACGLAVEVRGGQVALERREENSSEKSNENGGLGPDGWRGPAAELCRIEVASVAVAPAQPERWPAAYVDATWTPGLLSAVLWPATDGLEGANGEAGPGGSDGVDGLGVDGVSAGSDGLRVPDGVGGSDGLGSDGLGSDGLRVSDGVNGAAGPGGSDGVDGLRVSAGSDVLRVPDGVGGSDGRGSDGLRVPDGGSDGRGLDGRGLDGLRVPDGVGGWEAAGSRDGCGPNGTPGWWGFGPDGLRVPDGGSDGLRVPDGGSDGLGPDGLRVPDGGPDGLRVPDGGSDGLGSDGLRVPDGVNREAGPGGSDGVDGLSVSAGSDGLRVPAGGSDGRGSDGLRVPDGVGGSDGLRVPDGVGGWEAAGSRDGCGPNGTPGWWGFGPDGLSGPDGLRVSDGVEGWGIAGSRDGCGPRGTAGREGIGGSAVPVLALDLPLDLADLLAPVPPPWIHARFEGVPLGWLPGRWATHVGGQVSGAVSAIPGYEVAAAGGVRWRGWVAHPALAPEPLDDLDVQVDFSGTYDPEGALDVPWVRVRQGGLDATVALRAEAAGRPTRAARPEPRRAVPPVAWPAPFDRLGLVTVRGHLAPVDCQAAWRSLPRALTGPVAEAALAGRFAPTVDLRLPLADPFRLRLQVGGELGCRVEHLHLPPAAWPPGEGAGPRDDVAWLTGPFRRPIPEDFAAAAPRLIGPGAPGYLAIDAMPRFVVDAAIVSEDPAFGPGHALDLGLIRRALMFNLERGRYVYGGSTITQQLVKNLFLTREKTLARKVQEALIAVRLSQALSPRRILELYLNCIEFGPRVYGIQAAARHYFGKPVGALTPKEAAFLATAKPNPRYTEAMRRQGRTPPTAHYREYLRRILQRVADRGGLTAADVAAAYPLEIVWP